MKKAILVLAFAMASYSSIASEFPECTQPSGEPDQVIIESVRVLTPQGKLWMICFNGRGVAADRKEKIAWQYFVDQDLIPRLEKIRRRAREANELAEGLDIWQYE